MARWDCSTRRRPGTPGASPSWPWGATGGASSAPAATSTWCSSTGAPGRGGGGGRGLVPGVGRGHPPRPLGALARRGPRGGGRDDLRAQLGLLDGRVVAGDKDVVEPMLAKALRLWRATPGTGCPCSPTRWRSASGPRGRGLPPRARSQGVPRRPPRHQRAAGRRPGAAGGGGRPRPGDAARAPARR